jgi:hypothetical protein
MKKNIIIIVVVVIVAVLAFFNLRKDKGNQANNINNNTSTGCENISIENVKKQAQTTENNITQYASTTKDVLGKSTEGGTQTNFSLQGKNKLIKQTFFGETGKSEINYYLDNDKVFYFSKKNTEYILPLSQDSTAKIKSVELNEFYLGGNQNLCSWYSNQQIQPNTQAAQDTVNFLVTDLQ